VDEEEGKAVVDPDKCIGCGVCTVTCPEETLKLHRFERPEAPFDNMVDWAITIARDNERM
jgi:ferredoxin